MRIWNNEKKVTKRRKFLLVSLLLSMGLMIVQKLNVESRYAAIGLLALSSYLLTGWSLFKDLHGVNWFINLILPTMYPVSLALFYFLLPQAFMTQTVVIVLFAISMYGLLLTSNIFAVASIRTIQLLRAARAVGFLVSILTSAFLYQVIFALKIPAWEVTAYVFGVSLPILWQGSWSYTVSSTIKREFYYALCGAIIIAEMALALSFWSISIPLSSVMLSMGMYVCLGIFQHDLEGRLFNRTIQEYLGFAVIVFIVVATSVLVQWSR